MFSIRRRGSSKRYETSCKIVNIPRYYLGFLPHWFRSLDNAIALFNYTLPSASRAMDVMASMVALINFVSMALLASFANTPGTQGVQGATALLQLLVLCGGLYGSLASLIVCSELDRLLYRLSGAHLNKFPRTSLSCGNKTLYKTSMRGRLQNNIFTISPTTL